MGKHSARVIIAAATFAVAVSAADAQPTAPAQSPQAASKSPLDRRATILDKQGVKRKTSSANQRYALPSVKMDVAGVKSKAPRGIGRKGGSLLPPPGDPQSPPSQSPRADPRPGPRTDTDDPWNGRLMLDRYGRVRAVHGGGETPRPMADPEVLQSGDNVAIARLLRPAIDLSYLSRYDRFLLGEFWPCGASPYFVTTPDPYTFSTDTYTAADTYAVDTGGLDPFLKAGGMPGVQGPLAGNLDPEADLTGFEKAGNRLYDGKPDEAVVLLRAYTQAHQGDAEAARALALALLDARRTREGVEMMAQVYERTPSLASSPIPPDAVGSEHELRDLVARVVEHAHKTNTSGAWLTVAMLMQAEGRVDLAFKMIERADGRALDPALSTAMRTALKP